MPTGHYSPVVPSSSLMTLVDGDGLPQCTVEDGPGCGKPDELR
jgi:hypothetical protein